MNIGELSDKSGVSARMIRKYEEQGLIPKARRTDAGYRRYKEEDVHVLGFVRRARLLGFSMKEIKLLLGLLNNKARTSAQVKKITARHMEELRKKKQEIDRMLRTLVELSRKCPGDAGADCAILDGIAGRS